MHGALNRVTCLACGAVSAWEADIDPASRCPGCGAAGRLRPRVVWFGEMPLYIDEIHAALGECGLFVSIGTSGNVYPAAGFVRAARATAETVELNLEASAGASLFDRAIHGRATATVPAFVEEVLKRYR
jgi:NAD-dependent deacetylase